MTGMEFDCCGIEEEEKQDEDGRDLKVGLLQRPRRSQVCQTEQNSWPGMVEPGTAHLGSGLM